MVPPPRDESCSESATPEMLAGLSVRIEAEEDLAVRAFRPPLPPTNGTDRPGVDQLAGIYIRIEASEDLTVHPPSANAQHS